MFYMVKEIRPETTAPIARDLDRDYEASLILFTKSRKQAVTSENSSVRKYVRPMRST